jgi:separase
VGGLRRTPSESPLRRSMSMTSPLSPVQPRTLNRTATIDAPSTKSSRSQPAVQPSSGCLSTVECARVAFTCLRVLKGSNQSCQKGLQAETAMSVFVARLLNLGLYDHALKEMRILKRRLEEETGTGPTKKAGKTVSPESAAGENALSELVHFKVVAVTESTRSLIINTQLHAIRLVSLLKKPAHIEGILPFLRESHPTSPLAILLADPTDSIKTARVLETLAGLISTLFPGSSTAHDGDAMESRLNPSPAAAFELQAILLKTRLHSWRMSANHGDFEKDILSPFSKFLAAFGRRLKPATSAAHELCRSAVQDVFALARELGLEASTCLKSPRAAVYQSLASSALSLKLYDEAKAWAEKLYGLLDVENDSSVRRCSVTAQLLAVRLKTRFDETEATDLVNGVLECTRGHLKGETLELDQLMIDLASARRAAVGVLGKYYEEKDSEPAISATLAGLLEELITQYIRVASRWLGKAPTRGGDTKDFIRFENRRQRVMSGLSSMLDSALVVAKAQITAGGEWSQVDCLLQSCVELLERIGDAKAVATGAKGNSYHVKISNLYYMTHSILRQNPKDSQDLAPLRALRRSVEALRDRSPREKESGNFVAKLERFADICVKFRRMDDARGALQTICTTMVEEGILSRVAAALGEKSPAVAWALDERTELLSRTLCSIAKLDTAWNDWTFFLPEAERAAVLERLMQLILTNTSRKRETLKVTEPLVDTLLRICSIDKFPVRRLRTLLHLFSMNITDPDESASLRSLIEATMHTLESNPLSEDSSLTKFVPHLKSYFGSLKMLPDWEPGNADFQSALAYWRSVSEAATGDDVLGRIDDPALLLIHLKALGDLASMRGETSLLLSLLEISANLSQKMGMQLPDEAVSCHSRLADHYVRLGYTKQAETTLDRVRQLLDGQTKVSGDVLAHFHLSLAEHSLAVGSLDKAYVSFCLSSSQ